MKSQEIMCPNCEGSGCIADAGYVNCTACNATGLMSYEKVHSIFYESLNQRHVITSTERREEKLRQSVTRLVGEWRDKEAQCKKNAEGRLGAVVDKVQGATFKMVADELSALIDGKGEG